MWQCYFKIKANVAVSAESINRQMFAKISVINSIMT